MDYGQIVNSFGLVLDIAGGIMLFKFGLPPTGVRPEGESYLLISKGDPESKRKYEQYKNWSAIAIWLVIIGFGFQLVGNFL